MPESKDPIADALYELTGSTPAGNHAVKLAHGRLHSLMIRARVEGQREGKRATLLYALEVAQNIDSGIGIAVVFYTDIKQLGEGNK